MLLFAFFEVFLAFSLSGSARIVFAVCDYPWCKQTRAVRYSRSPAQAPLATAAAPRSSLPSPLPLSPLTPHLSPALPGLSAHSEVLSTPPRMLVAASPCPPCPSTPPSAPAPALSASSSAAAPSPLATAPGVMPAPPQCSHMLSTLPSMSSTSPLNAVSQSARVEELASAELAASGAQPLAAPPADSAKCLAPLLLIAAPHAHPQAQACRDGGDNREKQISTPTPAPIASPPRAMLLSTSSSTSSSHQHVRISAAARDTPARHVLASLPAVAATSSAAAAASSSAVAQPIATALAQPPQRTAASSLPHPAAPSVSSRVSPVSGVVVSSTASDSSDSLLDHPMDGLGLSGSDPAGAGLPSSVVGVGVGVSSSALPPQAPRAASAKGGLTSAFFARLKNLFDATASSAAARPSHPSSASATSTSTTLSQQSYSLTASSASSPARLAFDLSCHCLVVDRSKLTSGSADAAHLDHALSLVDRNEMLEYLRGKWLTKLHGPSLAIAYTDPEVRVKVLHLNFDSLDSLSAALQAYPFLCRCGTVFSAASWGHQAKCCGPSKHQLPEMLQLRCTTTTQGNRDLSQLNGDIERLLKEMKLEGSLFWSPPKVNPAQQQEVRYVMINVLPRFADLPSLSAAVERTHCKHQLWGGTVRVHAPNTASLRRCSQCAKLGHDAEACPQYNGLAVRLLFKQPVPFQQLMSMQLTAGAARAYIGRGFEDLKPHRKVTLLFDLAAHTEDELHALYKRLEPLLEQVRPLLYQEPTEVKPMERHRECRECGSTLTPHSCAFSSQPLSLMAIMRNKNAVRQQQAASGSTLAPAAAARRDQGAVASEAAARVSTDRRPVPSAEAKANKSICKTWRRLHSCPRGDACQYEHPTDHTPTATASGQGVCFAFRDRGFCAAGSMCRFPHVGKDGAPVVKAAAPLAPAAAAASSSSSVAASSPVISVPAIDQPTAGAIVSTSQHSVSIEDEEEEKTASAVSAPVDATPPRAASPAPASAATRAAAPAPATPSRKRRSADTDPLTQATEGPDVDEQAPASARAKKTRRAIAFSTSSESAAAIPTHANRFALSRDEDEEASAAPARAPSATAAAPPVSSLSSLSSLSSPQRPTAAAAIRRSESGSSAAAKAAKKGGAAQ